MPIENISDTARWVAVYRAMETERPDAIFRDPYARRLAGERGEEILREMPQGVRMAWAMIVRTAVLDELIMRTIERDGADTVLNLAAGLDTRAWRLDLPAALRWVDVDLPGILRQKTDAMRGETPRCRYEAVEADLADRPARQALLARIGAASRGMLVVSEGLLVYLDAAAVADLAADLAAVPSARWWLSDLASPRLLEMMTKMWGRQVGAGNAPFRFAPAEGTGFFARFGWRESEFRSSMEDAQRLRREMPGMPVFRFIGRFTGARRREEARRMSAVVMLERV